MLNNYLYVFQLSEAPDDPAGDNDAASPVAAETMVEKILTLL